MTRPQGPGPASTGPGPMPASTPTAARAGASGVDVFHGAAGRDEPSPTAMSRGEEFSVPGSGSVKPARDVDALAEPVAAAVLSCPSVAALSTGPFGTVGTYLPGRRVTGVQITEDEVTVRVVARLAPVGLIENQVRRAVSAVIPGMVVHLAIDDLDPG